MSSSSLEAYSQWVCQRFGAILLYHISNTFAPVNANIAFLEKHCCQSSHINRMLFMILHFNSYHLTVCSVNDCTINFANDFMDCEIIHNCMASTPMYCPFIIFLNWNRTPLSIISDPTEATVKYCS